MTKGFAALLLPIALLGCGEDQHDATYYLKNEAERVKTHKGCQAQGPRVRATADCLAAKAAHEQIAMDLVRRDLKDPQSALFDGMYSAWETEVCGNVNAKNSYGGYVGKRVFYANVDAKTVIFFDGGGLTRGTREGEAALRCMNWTIHIAEEALGDTRPK